MPALLLYVLACSVPTDVREGGAPPPKVAPPAATVEAPPQHRPPPESGRVLAPSPAGAARALEAAGVSVALADLVPRRLFPMDGPDPRAAAICTGVVLADTVLTATTANDHDLAERLRLLQVGLAAMDATPELRAKVDELSAATRAGTLDRAALATGLDELAALTIPTAGGPPGTRRETLLQTGVWIATTNLTATALLRSGDVTAADPLLRQTEAATWFLSDIRSAAAGRDGEDLLRALEGQLGTLRDATAASPLTRADVVSIQEHTEAILNLL